MSADIIDLEEMRKRIADAKLSADEAASLASATGIEHEFAQLAHDAQEHAAEMARKAIQATEMLVASEKEKNAIAAAAMKWKARAESAAVAEAVPGLELEVARLIVAQSAQLTRIEANQVAQAAQLEAVAEQQALDARPFWQKHPILTGIGLGVGFGVVAQAVKTSRTSRARMRELETAAFGLAQGRPPR